MECVCVPVMPRLDNLENDVQWQDSCPLINPNKYKNEPTDGKGRCDDQQLNDSIAYLNKKYKLEYVDDKFEEVMKILGVGFMKRKLGNVARPVMELKEKDGEYTLTSESVFKNIETKFKLGEEFQEETADGRTVTSIFTQDGDTLTQVQRGDKTTTITREFSPDQVKVMVEVDGVNSTRIYKAV